MTINLITLGCSKNLVDSEKLLYQLKKNGHEVVHNSEGFTEGLIINTCGFILDAKQESIETILQFAEAKKQGFIDKIAVMGCLSERYKESLQKEIPEVDAMFGVSDLQEITAFFQGNYYADELYRRINHTPSHYAYLKISEGCNRRCAFCAIPGIRGKQVSLSVEDLVKEAEELARKGARELILIAQELSSYGMDIYGKKALPDLITSLLQIRGPEWIRLHYVYPDGFPLKEIVDLMKKHPALCRYLDIPVQHASDRILKRMKRGHTRRNIEKIIDTFKEEVPGVSLRTTVITGFPGESKVDFKELKEFVSDFRFDRLGVFAYSHEEGTTAYAFDDDVPEDVKTMRMEEIMQIQEKISLEKNLEKKGKSYKVLIDEREGEFYMGRTEHDSPEVDNNVLIPADDMELRIGEFYEVEIFDALEFDVYGRVKA